MNRKEVDAIWTLISAASAWKRILMDEADYEDEGGEQITEAIQTMRESLKKNNDT